ncbi:hypothetical protein, partial [Massilia pseudoviolaceinigra]|uniref:hypothetical protein n=1 Tax=Massilia pseudoviolaceinigra TaxID=3057165 RepID=UPI00279649C1
YRHAQAEQQHVLDGHVAAAIIPEDFPARRPGSRESQPSSGWLFSYTENSSINFHVALNAVGETVVLY